MKIRITKAGIFGADGAIPVGTEITLKGELPAGWAGKYRVTEAAAADDTEPVANPAKTKKRAGLEKQATDAGVEFTDDTTDDELAAAIKAKKPAS